ncbi:putative ribonuclease H-like domain-containing protein [Tanacetum coccineum]
MAQVRKLSPEQLQEEFDKIQRAVAFTRGLKRDSSPMSTTSSKKHKTGDVELDIEAPSHGVSHEVEVEAPSQNVSREKVAAPSHSQNILEAQAKFPSRKLHFVERFVDWELLPTGLGSINAIYKLDNSRKYFTSLREIRHLVTRADLMMIYGRVMMFYQDKKAEGVGLVLLGDLQILMDSPEVNDGISGQILSTEYKWSMNLTAVQLIAFLKKQISDSKRPKCAHQVLDMETVFGMLLGFVAMYFVQTEQFSGIGCWLTTTQQMVFNSPCLTDKKELIHHEGTALDWLVQMQTAFGKDLTNPLIAANLLKIVGSSTHLVITTKSWLVLSKRLQFNKATKTTNPMVLEGVLMKNKDDASSRLICAEFSSIQVKTQADWMLLQSSYFNPQVSTSRYVVPTGRVVVPTGRYIVLAGKVIIIVSTGRLSLVPTGSDNESDDASVHSEATIAQQRQNIQPQIITTVSNNNAKFPYLKKDETGRDRDGRVIILPPMTADEHIAVQRESKARTTLLQSIPDDHKMRKSMLKQEFSEFRISEAEGLHKGYDRMQKILSFTRRRSDVTSVFKEATLPENAGQREEMTSKDIPHSRFQDDGQGVMEVIAPKEFDLIAGCDTEDALRSDKSSRAVLLRMAKLNIPLLGPQNSSYGKAQVPAPVPTGRQNEAFPVPMIGVSSIRLDGATAVKLQQENPYSDAEDEGIFDSGCSRSMTGNMERLDDFQEFQGGKVTFGGGEGRITGKGTIRTPTLDFENVYYDFMLPVKKPVGTKSKSYKDVLNGTQDVDSDSECDEQVIIVPSYPSHNIQEAEPKDTFGNEVDDSPLDSAEDIFQQELARLKGREQRATSDAKDAEELQKRAIPTGGVPIPTGSPPDSFFDDEPTTRFPGPSDLGNIEPLPGIFSSSSYDDEFGADLNNLASTVEVSPVATNRINTNSSSISDYWGSLLSCVYEIAQVKPRSVAYALEDPSWVDAMQEEMQQFKFQNRDARGIVVRNKARLVAQGYRQEEGIDLMIMDVKECYFFMDELITMHMSLKLRVLWILNIPMNGLPRSQSSIGLHQAPRSGLQVQQRPDGIFISQDKYVQEILKKFDLECVRTATTPYEAPKPKSKNEPDSPVNVHLYRSMIGSLMYLTASRPDIMFAVSACSRNQVTPTTSNLEAVKKIFKYLKGQPRLGLWYPRESPFVLEAYSDSDYAGANKDRKSTTGGCQFLGRRLISWQCKKQTIMATSSTEAEYVVAANCCGQLNFEGLPMQLLAAMLPQDQEGAGAGVAAQAVPPPIPEPIPEPMPEPDQPQDHAVAEDLIILTVVSFVVSTLVQKVNSLETELKDTRSYLCCDVIPIFLSGWCFSFHIPKDVSTGLATAGVSNIGKIKWELGLIENKTTFQSEKEAIFLLFNWCDSFDVQAVKTICSGNLGRVYSRDGDSMSSYFSRFYKLMNEFDKEQLRKLQQCKCKFSFFNKLSTEWSRFVTIVNKRKDRTSHYHKKLFDILKQFSLEILISSTKTQRANATSSSTRQSSFSKHKGKAVAKPNTPQSEMMRYYTKFTIDNSPMAVFGNQRTMTVAGARETVGSQVVKQTGIQCFNCKGYGNYAKECRKPKRVKDYAYHKKKMMMCKQAEQGVPLQAEQADWLRTRTEEIDELGIEAHYS